MTWSGLYTPIITPFKNDHLDEEGLRTLLHFQQKSGVEGIVLLGTTGEAATLTAKEKERILKIARQEIRDLPLIVGTGTNSTLTTIETTLHAADQGADAALVITPAYNKPTQEGLFLHYEALANASPIPIFIYNNPSRTGVDIELETLKKTAQLPQVVGMKESSRNLLDIARILTQVKGALPDFTFLTGEDALLFPIMAMGADGAIGGGANLIPKQMHTLIHLVLKNDFTRARELYYQILPLFEVLSVESHPIPLKFAMQCVGLPAGEPRLPMTPLTESFHEEIKKVLGKLQLMPEYIEV